MGITVGSPITNLENVNLRCLKSRIISQYEGDTWSEIILLEKFRMKIARRASKKFSSSTINI